MKARNKKYLENMINQINRYQDGSVTLRTMHENLWELFEAIDGLNKDEEFCALFHQYWDHIEEIIAIGKINQYLHEINNTIVPHFKQKILEYLRG